MAFETQFYRPFDLERAVRGQYGQGATLTHVSEHLYDWRARLRVNQDPDPPKYLNSPIDLRGAAEDQHGAGWIPVPVGVHRYDWRAVRFSDLVCMILPIMLVACDRFFDIDGVRTGLIRYRSVLCRIQSWYKLRAGATFRLLQPLVIPTRFPSARWNDLSERTDSIPEERFVLLTAAQDEYSRQLPPPGGKLPVVLALYTGDSPQVWLGAAAGGGFTVVPPRATSILCPPTGPLDEACSDATYAIGHELGHNFGLCHSCEVDCFPNNPNCAASIMAGSKPPDAILLEEEVDIVRATCFFPKGKGPILPLSRSKWRRRRSCAMTREGPAGFHSTAPPARPH
jgi:hypothetical protein